MSLSRVGNWVRFDLCDPGGDPTGDPFAEPPPITENDIKDGMFSLLNRGIIPRDVDLTPAFERGNAPFAYK